MPDGGRRIVPPTPWPEGLRREKAAAYLGISPSKFDEGVERGIFPQPINLIDSVHVWSQTALYALINPGQDAPANGAGWGGA